MDHANNDSRRDVNNHRLDKVNGKINSFDAKIRHQEATLNNFHDTVKNQRHDQSAISSINNFYGKSQTVANGFNYKQTGGPSQYDLKKGPNNNFQTDKNWNHSKAINELYNKRDQNSYEFYQQNQSIYWKRAEVDKNLVQFNKKMNDGEAGRVPWGTGYQNQMKTSSSQFGQHYQQS